MKTNLKEYLIKEFILAKERVPSQTEVTFLYNLLLEENPLIEEEGLLPSERSFYCQANEESNAAKYNLFLDKCRSDIKNLITSFDSLKELQRNLYSDRSRILNSFLDKYKSLERKLNFAVLLKQENDVFSYEVLEDFNDLSKVDIERSNIYHLDDDRVTIGVNKSSSYLISLNELSFSVRHRRGSNLSEKLIGSFSNILKEDNKFFRIETTSNIPDDIVEFVVDINFLKEKDVNELKYITAALESNSSLIEDCYYSLNGTDYIHIDEYETSRRVFNNRNILSFNNEDSSVTQKIKAIKLILRKTAYDLKTDIGYAYHFGMDYIGYIARRYNVNTESVLYAGPYEVLDEDGVPYNYSIARIDKGTCCEIPNKTSLDIYISKDNVNFIKAEFNQEHNPIIQFNNNWGNAKSFEDFDLINENSENDFILDENELELNISNSQDIFNLFIPEASIEAVNLKSIQIKRNLLDRKKNNSQIGIYTGWIKVGMSNYSCIFKCSDPEGRIVDFGSDTIDIDGVRESGKRFIKYGTHKVIVRDTYFTENDFSDVNSVRQLNRVAIQYPYDHKLLIEGFSYSNKFKGKRVFTGFEDIRGCDLSLVSLENLKESNSLKEFSLVNKENNVYFLINSSEEFGKREDFSITYRKNLAETGNLLYIKAILKTKDARKTPKIDKIQIRVL
jgi:hypothetical protein